MQRKFAHTPAGGELLATMLTARQLYQMTRQRLAERLEQIEPDWAPELEAVAVRALARQAAEPIDKDAFLSGLSVAVQWGGREVIRPQPQKQQGPFQLPWGAWPRGRTLLILGELEPVEEAAHHVATLLSEQLDDANIIALGVKLTPLSPQGWLDLPCGYFFPIESWTGCCNKREKVMLWTSNGVDSSDGLIIVLDLAGAYTSPPFTRHAVMRAAQAHQRLRQHAQACGAMLIGGLVEAPTDENLRWCRELFQAWASVARATQQEDGRLKLELPDLEPYLWTPDE